MSIRRRLTLWYSVILAVTLTAFGILLYVILANGWLYQAEQSLVAKGEEIARSMDVRTLHPTGELAVMLPKMDVFTSPGIFVQATDIYGAVVARSSNLGDQTLPVTRLTRDTIKSGRPSQETIRVANRMILLYNRPMFPDTRGTGVIQVGLALAPLQTDLGRLRLLLIIVGGASLVTAGSLGSLLAARALRPINRITQTAQAIGTSQDMSRRVEYSGPGDEVRQLASTFNEMLARLEAAQQRLTATLAAQRRFVADASHELRTPLTVIRTNAEVLRLAGPSIAPADRNQVIDDIIGEADRLGRLVSDLLTLARADSGLHLDKSPLDLAPILREVHRQAVVLGPDHHVSLEAADEETLPVQGHADSLKQLALILVDNAIKYTPAGGSVFMVARRDDGRITLSVTDSGMGIPRKDLPHIFDRFYRADPARGGSGGGGSGLGLAIARWIVEEHGGEIKVESRPRQGTTFTVALPAAGLS